MMNRWDEVILIVLVITASLLLATIRVRAQSGIVDSGLKQQLEITQARAKEAELEKSSLSKADAALLLKRIESSKLEAELKAILMELVKAIRKDAE